jgi:NADPH:quinone reductase-like Zn-dependent oxidoreductase
MRAAVFDRYGPPEVLRLEDVARPVPKQDEVLVMVCATTVNRTDTGIRQGHRLLLVNAAARKTLPVLCNGTNVPTGPSDHRDARRSPNVLF